MNEPDSAEHQKYISDVGRQAERRERSQGESLWRGLAYVGGIGWMVSLLGVGGAYLGRTIDAQSGTGVRFSMAFLVVGLALGCFIAWRAVKREVRE